MCTSGSPRECHPVIVMGGMTLAPIVILITLPMPISLFSHTYRRSLRQQVAQEPAE